MKVVLETKNFMEAAEILAKYMTRQLADELLEGAAVVVNLLYLTQDGYIIIKRKSPRRDKDGRDFVYAQYFFSNREDPCIYLGCEYVAMTIREVSKRAWAKR